MYISKEKALKMFIEGDGDNVFTEGYNFAVDEYRTKIKAMISEDVQPVRRGRWFHSKENHGFIVCSQCKHEAYWDTDYGQQLFDYCPYCGARMDLKDGDTE